MKDDVIHESPRESFGRPGTTFLRGRRLVAPTGGRADHDARTGPQRGAGSSPGDLGAASAVVREVANPVLLQLLVEGAARYTEALRSDGDPPLGGAQHSLYVPVLDVFERAARLVGLGTGASRCGVEQEVLRREHVVRRQHRRALEDVSKLSNVSRPAVRLEARDGAIRERFTSAGAPFRDDPSRDQRDVLRALPERRDRQRHGIDPEQQVLPKPAFRHEAIEIAVRGGDEPDVHEPIAHLADAPEGPLLDRLQQLRLHRRVHVADLVEEQRAAVSCLEQTGRAPWSRR